jgi:outer membrane protein TolC
MKQNNLYYLQKPVKNNMLGTSIYPYILTYLLVLFFTTTPVNSQTLEDYLRIAAENNSGLKSRFFLYQASLERIPQVGALPDPQLSFGIFIEPMERYMGNQVAEISIMQMFPWFGTLGAARDEVTAMAKARYEEFNEAKTMLFYEVKATWYALYLLQKEITITEENIEILKSLEEIAISRLKSGGTGSTDGSGGGRIQRDQPTGSTDMGGMGMQGKSATGSTARPQNMGSMDEMGSSGSMVDVLRIQIEVNEMRNSLSLLHVNLHHLMSQFNNLLTRSTNESINIPDTVAPVMLPANISQMPDSIRLNNPMLRMLQKEEEAYMAQEKMNRKMGFPMIGIGLQYDVFQTRPGSMMEAKNMIMPMATISIPIWRSKYNASVQEARFMRDAVIEQRIDEGNRLIANYGDAMTDFNDANRRVELYKQQTQLAQQALNLLTTQYTTAGTAFEEVLRMQQLLLDYRLRGLDAIVDQNVAVAMLERLMGR